MSRLKTVLREPLVQFLALGGLLFLYFAWRGGGRARLDPNRRHARARRAPRRRLRPDLAAPADARRSSRACVDDYVREEIATREAHGDGPRPRRHHHPAPAAPEARVPGRGRGASGRRRRTPSSRPGSTGTRSRSRPSRGSRCGRSTSAATDAARRPSATPERLLARLRAAGPDAAIDELGDPSMVPQELPARAARARSRAPSVSEFAATDRRARAGPRGAGPIESRLRPAPGARARARRRPRGPTLAAVRPLVERELLAERRQEQLERCTSGCSRSTR